MANDTPFVDTTSRSPAQGTADRLVRGDDHADSLGGDEYLTAIAYIAHIKLQATRRLQLLAKLKGNVAARISIQAKTQALARNATPHIIDPVGNDIPSEPRGKALV